MRRFIRQNALSLAMLALCALILVGQSVAGLIEYNDERREHGQPAVGLVEYLGRGHFGEAVFENWESEFLQMAALVLLTAVLLQKGSPESKKPGGDKADEEPKRGRRDAPWPVRRGGWILKLYENSLFLALFGIFLLSFSLHAVTGAAAFNEQQQVHAGSQLSALEYALSARFWFESLQNWQSEFLAVGALAILGIFLRQKGSPESKPVAAPHSQTGS